MRWTVNELNYRSCNELNELWDGRLHINEDTDRLLRARKMQKEPQFMTRKEIVKKRGGRVKKIVRNLQGFNNLHLLYNWEPQKKKEHSTVLLQNIPSPTQKWTKNRRRTETVEDCRAKSSNVKESMDNGGSGNRNSSVEQVKKNKKVLLHEQNVEESMEKKKHRKCCKKT